MIAPFQGTYFWKMPSDVEIDIGASEHNLLPRTFSGGDRESMAHRTSWCICRNGHVETDWSDLYDSKMKLWKAQFWGARIRPAPQVGRVITNSVGAVTWDLQNSHASYWSSAGNPPGQDPLFDSEVPREYQDGVRCGSPSGLMQVIR